jgi:hypothetical protein
LIACILTLAGCKAPNSQETEKQKTPAVPEPKAPPIDAHYTSISRFIAGMKQTETNAFSELEAKPEWQEFAANFDKNWAQVEEKRLAPMRDWAKTELADANNAHDNVFYPFAGPDFLNAYTFFPKGKSYLFIGLEKPGDVPDLKAMDDKGRHKYFNQAFASLHNLIAQSYFITKEMMSELPGTTPVMLIFMARTHNQIVSVKHVAVDAEGKLVDIEEKEASKDPILRKAYGVKIDFLPEGEKEARTLYYFKADLADDKLQDNPGFVKYLDNLGPVTTYVKSASYLMHYKTFNTVREACLKHSNYLLQDDSGIAFRFFDKKAWKIGLYGTYTTPIKEFRTQYEKDLAAAYKGPDVKPLPFSLGYNTSTGGVNLLLASKQAQTAQTN